MKCELVEQLIPLYSGGDLEPPEADDLRRHLEACAACRQLAEEFAASQNWLAEFAAPDFDAPVFANFSASVISRIEQQQAGRSWFQWLLPKWNPRLMLAAATAALVVITGLAVAVYRNQTGPASGGENFAGNNKQVNPDPSPDSSDGTAKPNLEIGNASSARITPKALKSATRRSAVEIVTLPPEAFQNDQLAFPLEEPVTSVESAADGAPAEPEEKEMMRIELQTADPNIRIIWLTLKPDNSSDSKTK